MTEFPQWVKTRAVELANTHASGVYKDRDVGNPFYGALNALAEHILRYEKEPIDPDLVAAREYAADLWPEITESVRRGRYDDFIIIQGFLAGRKSRKTP